MTLSIKNDSLIFLGIFLPLFFGLNLRGSLVIKLLITAVLLIMSLGVVAYAIKQPKRMWTGKYGVYASVILGIIGWGVLAFFWAVSTPLTGWLSWLWWVVNVVCTGIVVGFVAIVHDIFVEKRQLKKN
ncbi:hypothetical protein ACUIJQ_11200 [Levilactobacillus hammesii]|nr:hypothetical protein [Levilactobacillus hammesii]